MLMRKRLLAMLILVIRMLTLEQLNMNTSYTDTDLCIRIMYLLSMLGTILRKSALNFANLSFRDS